MERVSFRLTVNRRGEYVARNRQRCPVLPTASQPRTYVNRHESDDARLVEGRGARGVVVTMLQRHERATMRRNGRLADNGAARPRVPVTRRRAGVMRKAAALAFDR